MKAAFDNESDEKQKQLKHYMDKLEGKEVPEHIMQTIDEEIKRFMQMENNHHEAQNTKTYLDYLTDMPWGIRSEENFDIKTAKETLDE